MTSFSRPDVHSVFGHAGVAVRNEESHETTSSPFVTSVAKISGGGENSALVDVANSLARRGSDGTVPSRITDVDYTSLVEWIRTERMRKLPVEGSSYDTALAWAMLFVERMQSFDIAMQQFSGDSQGAFQLVYAHCANLLEVVGQIHQAEKALADMRGSSGNKMLLHSWICLAFSVAVRRTCGICWTERSYLRCLRTSKTSSFLP